MKICLFSYNRNLVHPQLVLITAAGVKIVINGHYVIYCMLLVNEIIYLSLTPKPVQYSGLIPADHGFYYIFERLSELPVDTAVVL